MDVKRPSIGFELSEYQRRHRNAQRLMQAKNMAAIVLTTEHDIHYFSGFHTPFWQSPTRPWFVVLPANAEPIAVIPEIGITCMRSAWLTDIRSWASPAEHDDGVSLLLETLREVRSTATADSQAIGINMGRETHIRMPITDFDRLRAHLQEDAKQDLVDATPIIRHLRSLKSAAEIAKIHYCADRVSQVFEQVFDFVDVGMSDQEIFRAFKIQCLNAGVDDVAYLVGAADQHGYEDIISPPRGRVLRDGDVLILDTGCTFDGYYCDFDRNYGFGNIAPATHNAYRVVWEATEAALAMAKPGVRCAELFTAMNDVLSKAGALGDSVGRFGHGLGLQLTEAPSHTAWDNTILEAGMVLTLEPGMLFDKAKVMVHEENIAITGSGNLLLSRRAPEHLPCKV